MLDAATNELLTRTGPGTPMGELLRRYWQPIAGAAELDAQPVKRVRILGESLVLYRDGSGTLGLVDRSCPHRNADLGYGVVEQCGLRCTYHGWRFDEAGQCVEQPFEQVVNPDSLFRNKVKLKAYPVRELAGLVWAYLGPAPAPCLPDWDFFHDRGFAYVRYATLPCNWLQCQENAIDPVHLEWLHENWSRRLQGDTSPAPPHRAIDFRDLQFGISYHRLREGMNEQDPAWTTGRLCLWPNGFLNQGCSWRVPIDDENTLYVLFDRVPLPGTRPFQQTNVPCFQVQAGEPGPDEAPGEPSLVLDFAAMTGQGVISNRTTEHLGESDRGIILLRKRLLADVERVRRGEDPSALIRDDDANRCVPLPRMPSDNSVTLRGAVPEAVRLEIERLQREHSE